MKSYSNESTQVHDITSAHRILVIQIWFGSNAPMLSLSCLRTSHRQVDCEYSNLKDGNENTSLMFGRPHLSQSNLSGLMETTYEMIGKWSAGMHFTISLSIFHVRMVYMG